MDQTKKIKIGKTGKRIIAVVLIIAIIAGAVFLIKKKIGGGGNQNIMTDFVNRGAITSVVKGSGVALAKNSQTITVLTSGMVNDVFVKEGDHVSIGDALYTMDSTEAEKLYQRAERAYNAAKKELDEVYSSSFDPNIRADFSGIIINAEELNPGDLISRGQVLATLVDNSIMHLHLYFSYAYEKDIYEGQKAEISIPSNMTVLEGRVAEIRKVKRIVPEGTALFEVIFAVNNPGVLTEGTLASATITVGSESIYPYESGILKYSKSAPLKSKISGEVASSKLWNYAVVNQGDSIVKLAADSSEDGLAAAESAFSAAQKELDEAKKNLNSVNAKADIDGTVLSVGVFAGEQAEVGTVAINIADTTTMQIKASVDEMNVSHITPGMMVEINQWGAMAYGTVDSVSLSGQYENGVSMFPVVISIDNSEGTLMSGSYVEYSFTASENPDCLVAPIQAVKYVETEEGTTTVLFVRGGGENVVTLISEVPDIPEGFLPVKVEIGISDNYNVEILSGVEEGAEVFVNVIRSEMW